MKKTIMLVMSLLLLIFIGCGRQGKTVRHIPHLDNTPYQEDSILLTYATNPQRALVMLDSAVLLGHIWEFREMFIRATIFSMSLNHQRQDSALHICEALLQHDSVKLNPDNHEDILNLLMNINRLKQNYNEYLRWATEKVELLRSQDEEVERLRTEAEIGLAMTHVGQTEGGMAKIDHSIQELDQPGSIDRMDAFVIAVKRKISVLIEMGRQAEVLPLAQRILDRLAHYEQHPKEYAEDSYRLSWSDSPTNRDSYLDFTRAQAHGFMAIAYAETGNKAKAREHLTAFDESDYGHTFSARRMIVPAQMALGMYDEAMKTLYQTVGRMGADTINKGYAVFLRYRALIASRHGQAAETYDLMARSAAITKILSDSLHRSEAFDYAARYHAKEQQLQIQKAEGDRRQMVIILVAVSALFVVILIAAFYLLHQQNRIVNKNRALVRMMNESKSLPSEAIAPEYIDHEDLDGPECIDEIDDDQFDDSETYPKDAKKDEVVNYSELFESIDTAIRSERLYANAHLQRQDICQRFQISRTMLNNLLQQKRGNPSFPQYINSIRLDLAVKLLRESPDLTISNVAEIVGFTPANLRVQFINFYGMTPLEYKQNL